MKTLLPTLFSCLALGLVAGCGGDNDRASAPDASEQPAASSTTEQQTTDSEDTSAEPFEVYMKDLTFQPSSVTVPEGGTVTWTNKESVGHDVTKTGGPGPAFNSGVAGGMARGDTFAQTFKTSGVVTYVCRVHFDMKGTVSVR